jgi:hypothetical protein
MLNDWHKAYTELTDFVAEHSEIEISASVVSIPESIRLEFYRLFDDVRTAFLDEKFPILLYEARVIAQTTLSRAKVMSSAC